MHATVSSALPRTLRAHAVLALLTFGFLLNSLDRSIISVLLEPIGREFGASDTELGLLTGLVFAVVYAVAGLPIASWADGGRHRAVIVIGVLFWSAMTAACGLAPAFVWLLAARMGVAAGEAAGTPASHALIASYYLPERRATALSIYAIGAPAGVALAGLLGGHGYALFGWRMTLMFAALPGVLLAAAMMLVLEHPARLAPRVLAAPALSWLQTIRAMWPMRAYRHLWIASALHCTALFSASSFNTAFLMRSHGWSAPVAGTLVGALGIAGAFGTFAGGWCADLLIRRHGGDVRWNLKFAAMTTLLTAPFQCAAYLVIDSASVMVLLPLAGFLGNAFLGPTYAATQSFAPPAARSRAVAVLMLAMTLVGMGLGPLLVGVTSDTLDGTAGTDSLRYALLLAPVCNVWAAAHFFLAGSSSRPAG
jgi:MFS family permease